MRCGRARTAIVERRLGLAGPQREVWLEDHLASCAACSEEARGERAFALELAALRQVEVPRIDVTARVMREVKALGEPRRRELPSVHAAAAALLGAALLSASVGIGLGGLLVTLPAAIPEARGLGSAVAVVLAGVLSTLAAVFRASGRAALDLVGAGAPLLAAIADLGRSVTLAAILLMSATTALVLGRDLGRRGAARREGQP